MAWKRWGPYLAERAWGTVREDYSDDGDGVGATSPTTTPGPGPTGGARTAWAGICDDGQHLCLAFAFWNGRDPILKERIFGLTGNEGNHGEDAKEYWWYLDSTPTHSWMRWRYVYPQREFPYDRLVAENGRRGRDDPEFELLDTGDLRRRPLLGHRRRLREGRRRTTRASALGPQRRPRGGHAARAAHAVVPQHVVVGPRRPPTGHRSGERTARLVAEQHELGRRARWSGRRPADAAVLRERVERPAAVGRRRRHALPEGRHQRPRRCTARPPSTRTARDEGRALVPAHGARRRDRRDPAAAARTAARDLGPSSTW